VTVRSFRHVIVTADDFGLDLAINEAVEQAFTGGVLTAASLMVGQPASGDAVERARRLPGLRVGLHVTLTGARPTLAPQRLPDLVDAAGRLPVNLAALGWRLAASPRARRQAEQEIGAQFQAFADTGLALDHANGAPALSLASVRAGPDPAHRPPLRVARGARSVRTAVAGAGGPGQRRSRPSSGCARLGPGSGLDATPAAARRAGLQRRSVRVALHRASGRDGVV